MAQNRRDYDADANSKEKGKKEAINKFLSPKKKRANWNLGGVCVLILFVLVSHDGLGVWSYWLTCLGGLFLLFKDYVATEKTYLRSTRRIVYPVLGIVLALATYCLAHDYAERNATTETKPKEPSPLTMTFKEIPPNFRLWVGGNFVTIRYPDDKILILQNFITDATPGRIWLDDKGRVFLSTIIPATPYSDGVTINNNEFQMHYGGWEYNADSLAFEIVDDTLGVRFSIERITYNELSIRGIFVDSRGRYNYLTDSGVEIPSPTTPTTRLFKYPSRLYPNMRARP